jgi:peroxygenase
MAPTRMEKDGFDTTIKEVPVTEQRRPFITENQQQLSNPGERFRKEKTKAKLIGRAGTARANLAASVEAPYGTQKGGWAREHADETVSPDLSMIFQAFASGGRPKLMNRISQVLQQHCAFFDTDSDGVIWPFDTYRGVCFSYQSCSHRSLNIP